MVETILKLIFDFKDKNIIFVVCLVCAHIVEGLRLKFIRLELRIMIQKIEDWVMFISLKNL